MKFLKKWVLNIGNKVLIFLCSTMFQYIWSMFQYIWSITNFTQIYSFSFLLKMTFRCLKWQFCCLYNTHHEKMTHSGEKSGGCFHSSHTSTCPFCKRNGLLFQEYEYSKIQKFEILVKKAPYFICIICH